MRNRRISVVRCREEKSVNCTIGSKRMLHRDVKMLCVSTISSKLFCFVGILLKYIPPISVMITRRGPAHLIREPPYNTVAQNIATTKKLSHGSSDHDINPTNLVEERRNGYECARARVICEGVTLRSESCRSVVLRLDCIGEKLALSFTSLDIEVQVVEAGIEVGIEVGIVVGVEVGVEVSVEVGVEVGIEVGVEVGVEVSVEVQGVSIWSTLT